MEFQWRLAFAILGNIVIYILLALEIPTIWQIWKRKSTEDVHGRSYLFAFLVSILWFCYSLPFVVGSSHVTILCASSAAIAVQCCFIIFYIIFATPKAKIRYIQLLAAILVFVALLIFVTRLVLPKPGRGLSMGLLCAGFTIALYAFYHVTVMKTLFANKTVDSKTSLFAFLIFMNSITWVFYGIFSHNKFVGVSNGMGSFLGGGQLIMLLVLHLYVWRNCPTAPPHNIKPENNNRRSSSFTGLCTTQFDAVLLPT